MKTSPRIAIVGGGVIGMYLALSLRRRGFACTLFEASADTGGLAAPADVGPYRWDRFYHVLLMSDANTRELIADLGLEDRLRWGTTRTGFYTDGTLYSLSDAIEFLRFPPLTLIDKFRLGATIFYASRIKNWRALEEIPVVPWLRRLSGNRVTDKIWLPLLKSKLGNNYELASASFLWAIIARLYAARRAGLKREMFGHVDDGYEIVLQKLRRRLQDEGVEIATGVRVTQVGANGNLTTVTSDAGQRPFDQVILTIPTPYIADLCPQLTEAERTRLRAVTYQGIVCASLLLRKPLADFYVTNITEGWVPFTGVIEMTALVDRARFGGHALVYLPRYLTQDDAFWNRSDEEVRELFESALTRLYPSFRRDDVVAFNVSRARHVLALSTLNYSRDLLPPVSTSLPGVAIINSAQIANGTLNVNETLAVAKAGLAALESRLADLGRQH